MGGAHNTCACPEDDADCPEDIAVEGECPELGGEDPMSTIQYITKGVAETEDESGFGLDAYEPFFFYPFGDWLAGCGGDNAPCHVEFEACDSESPIPRAQYEKACMIGVRVV